MSCVSLLNKHIYNELNYKSFTAANYELFFYPSGSWLPLFFVLSVATISSVAALAWLEIFFIWYSPSRWTQDEWILISPILEISFEKWLKLKALVNRLANWYWVLTWINLIPLANTLSLTTWQSLFMCLVLLWNTGLEPIWRADWLSQKKKKRKKEKARLLSHVLLEYPLEDKGSTPPHM